MNLKMAQAQKIVSSQESNLTALLNKGLTPFQDYRGPIIQTIGGIRLDGRAFSGGDIVLRQRLDALLSEDEDKIAGWGNYFTLADLVAVSEDSVKFQANSGFLTGIRGAARSQDGLHAAIDAEAVKLAVGQDNMKYFKVRGQETVHYWTRDGEKRQETALNVVLLPYNIFSMEFTPDQFGAINVPAIKRKDMIYGKDMGEGEIVNDKGEVVHHAWKIYPADVIVPLVKRLRNGFRFEGNYYKFDRMMGLYLPNETKNNGGEARALVVGVLSDGSWLGGVSGLGNMDNRLLGVVGKDAEGIAPRLAPWENSALSAMRQGNSIAYSPNGTYVRTIVGMQPAK